MLDGSARLKPHVDVSFHHGRHLGHLVVPKDLADLTLRRSDGIRRSWFHVDGIFTIDRMKV